MTPKIIYSLWFQGASEAPDVVRLCFRRWAALNHNYELKILDRADVHRLLAWLSIPLERIPLQALSDIVRTRLLVETGGIWVDATVFPVKPLDAWLPCCLEKTGFFAFERPGPDRPLSSWFIAASRGNVLIERWWKEVDRFWNKLRRLATYDSGLIPADPEWEVSPEGGAAKDQYPYFWLHYLFGHLLKTDAEFAMHWSHCHKFSAEAPHRLQQLFSTENVPGYDAVVTATRGAPVQKLDWRKTYPIYLFEEL